MIRQPYDGPRVRRAQALRRVLPLVAAAIGLALVGCINPFLPSKPEPPVIQGSEDQVTIHEENPDSVLSTIRAAIRVKGRGNGSQAYLQMFADSTQGDPGLVIEFDPDVVAERIAAGKAAPDWTRSLEGLFYNYLFQLSADDVFTLTWGSYPSAPNDVTDSNTWILYREYVLTGTSNEGSVADTIAIGRADLHIYQASAAPQRWRITQWIDHVDPAYPPATDVGHKSFSRLRIDSKGH